LYFPPPGKAQDPELRLTPQFHKLSTQDGSFPEAHKEVNYIYGGPDSYESRQKQKLTSYEVMALSPAAPEYLKWSEVPITFDRSDHLNFVPKTGWYPPIVCHIIKDVKLNRVLIDGGSSLNILFLKIFNQMRVSRSLLRPSRAPFHAIVHGVAATPIDQIALPMTFRTRENFFVETIQLEVTISRLRITLSCDGQHSPSLW
jgi:hypothetical protein